MSIKKKKSGLVFWNNGLCCIISLRCRRRVAEKFQNSY